MYYNDNAYRLSEKSQIRKSILLNLDSFFTLYGPNKWLIRVFIVFSRLKHLLAADMILLIKHNLKITFLSFFCFYVLVLFVKVMGHETLNYTF